LEGDRFSFFAFIFFQYLRNEFKQRCFINTDNSKKKLKAETRKAELIPIVSEISTLLG